MPLPWLIVLICPLLVSCATHKDQPNAAAVATPAATAETTEPDVADIIVDQAPLKIPESFKQTLRDMGITGMTLGDKAGRVRLLTADGRYLNPCDSQNKNPAAAPNSICKFQAGLAEAHQVLLHLRPPRLSRTQDPEELAAGCGTCLANNVSRTCKLSTNQYRCSAVVGNCQTACQ
jgi:hypothetical protein